MCSILSLGDKYYFTATFWSVQIFKNVFVHIKCSKRLENTVTNQNFIHDEIKSRLRFVKACYLSVQNVQSRRILSCIHVKTHTLLTPIPFCIRVKLTGVRLF
jgi:hypothetical protein